MAIRIGDKFPDATLMAMGTNGPETVKLSDRIGGRKAALFGLPGAYTGTCSTAHVPSFIRTADAFRGKGVDEIICVSVNDPFVMAAWGEATGATEAGISMLADPDGAFTRAIGMEFSAPQAGLIGRSRRYAVALDDGVVTAVGIDEPGECKLSAGEEILAAL